jgi:hypothetical protein
MKEIVKKEGQEEEESISGNCSPKSSNKGEHDEQEQPSKLMKNSFLFFKQRGTDGTNINRRWPGSKQFQSIGWGK